MSRRQQDPHEQLGRRIDQYLGAPFQTARVASTTRRWASATFTGARHNFVYDPQPTGNEAGLERLKAEICEADFDLPGHIVADIRLAGSPNGGLSVDALTVEIC